MPKNLKVGRRRRFLQVLLIPIALVAPMFAQNEPHPEDDTKLPLEIRKQAQEILRELGYDLELIDGELGAQTRKALRRYQRKTKLRITGMLDENTLKSLLSEGRRG